LIQEGQFPFHVLFIDIGPGHIDVNVHPTKTEIKFDDERTIYSLVKTSVRKALGSHNITPSIDFSVDTNFGQRVPGHFQSSSGHTGFNPGFQPSEREKANLKNWEAIFMDTIKTETPAASISREEIDQLAGQTVTFNSAANDLRNKTSQQDFEIREPGFFQIHNSYIATQVKSGLMLVDQQRAHERILYEKYLEKLKNNTGATQQNLFPERVQLNPSDLSLVKEIEHELKVLGFQFEDFGNGEMIIQGIPPDISGLSGSTVFTGIIEEYKRNHLDYKDRHGENLARAMAKNSCIKTGKKMVHEEMVSLFDRLFACKNPNYNMDGQLIYYILGLEKIANLFNKKL
jgi:DNA mismatch repair protein MutL